MTETTDCILGTNESLTRSQQNSTRSQASRFNAPPGHLVPRCRLPSTRRRSAEMACPWTGPCCHRDSGEQESPPANTCQPFNPIRPVLKRVPAGEESDDPQLQTMPRLHPLGCQPALRRSTPLPREADVTRTPDALGTGRRARRPFASGSIIPHYLPAQTFMDRQDP